MDLCINWIDSFRINLLSTTYCLVVKLHYTRKIGSASNNEVTKSVPLRSGSQTRLLAILLAVVTLGAIGLAIANLVQENNYPAPTDGARWIETQAPG
jgi:hypothetical protein